MKARSLQNYLLSISSGAKSKRQKLNLPEAHPICRRAFAGNDPASNRTGNVGGGGGVRRWKLGFPTVLSRYEADSWENMVSIWLGLPCVLGNLFKCCIVSV